MIVPTRFPTIRIAKRIAVIGEAPGVDEERIGQPFVGASGRFLAALLARSGVSRDACLLGNISQHRPPTGDISSFSWNGLQIQHGLSELTKDIERFDPNVVILLGNAALKAAMDPVRDHALNPKSFTYKTANYRGSILVAEAASPFAGRKVMPTYHPAYCLRDYSCTPLLEFDLRRAIREADRKEFVPRVRECVVPTSIDGACTELYRLREARKPTGTDIEGYWNGMTCISFANDPLKAVVIPFVRCDGTRYWQAHEEPTIWRAVAGLLEDFGVPKVLQNGLYDRFCLGYGHGIRVRNCAEDTMLKWWELYAELPKALDCQVSVLIPDVPYYKGDRKTMDDATFFRYNGMDSMVTLEIAQTLDRVSINALPEVARAHYRLNNALLNPLLYMEQRGIAYDSLGALMRRNILQRKMYEAQARLNGMTGRFVTSVDEIWRVARESMAKVKPFIALRDFDGIITHAYAGKGDDAQRLATLMRHPSPDLATLGEVEDICGISLNLGSDDQFIPFLYEELKLPTQTNKDKKTGDARPTGDYEALLRLSKLLQRDGNVACLTIIQLAIEIRALETRQRMLGIYADEDGRVRCGYNIVGSETGRVQCYTSPTGSGYALQTIPNYETKADAPGGICGDRDLFLADVDCWFAECDLKGADGWTVAAYAAMLGDPTMLEDYLAGLAPFDIMVLRYRKIDVDFNDRRALKQAKDANIKKSDWDRFAFKRVQHGGSYLEGGLTISNNILRDSEGKCFIEPNECKRFRDDIFFARYPGIRRWHNWVASRLRERPELTAASGQVRKFFGRPDEILTQAVAFEPQANTTYATNLALYKLWTDPTNRLATKTNDVEGNNTLDSNGTYPTLRIKPVHQVHDALCCVFQRTDTPWAIARIREYFNNGITIAGQKLVIPFDGAYGKSWGDKNEGKI
jgi:DNA polymerase